MAPLRLTPVALLLLLKGIAARDIFVSPSGSGSGSIEDPLGSIQQAVNDAEGGDTIYLREGTYAPSANIQVGKSGTSSAPITVRPYEGEGVIIDGQNMPG